MGVLKEFKDFAMRGNLVDMAIGVVMAGAFGKVVSAFIDGMVMPAVGMLTGGIDFTKQKIILKQAIPAGADGVGGIEEVAIKYGDFITQTLSFIVVALVVFVIIKAINRMKEKQEEAPAAGPSSTDTLLMEIRDELKRNN